MTAPQCLICHGLLDNAVSNVCSNCRSGLGSVAAPTDAQRISAVESRLNATEAKLEKAETIIAILRELLNFKFDTDGRVWLGCGPLKPSCEGWLTESQYQILEKDV